MGGCDGGASASRSKRARRPANRGDSVDEDRAVGAPRRGAVPVEARAGRELRKRGARSATEQLEMYLFILRPRVLQMDGKSALRVATDQGFYPIVQELLLAGAIVDWTDKVPTHGVVLLECPLHFAHLLLCGCTRTTQVEFQSPLHRASMHGFLDIVKLLLDHGADIERRDRVR